MEARVRELVAKMFAKKPAGTSISPDVCVTVLKAKYAAEFGGVDWDKTVKPLVAVVLAELEPPKPAARPAKAAAKESSSEEEDSDDDDSDSDGSSESGEEGGDFNSEEGEGDEDEEGSDDESDVSSTGDDEEDDGAAAGTKKHRTESGDAESSVADQSDAHTRAMIAFAKTVKLSVRPIADGEDLAAYRAVLDAAFTKHGLSHTNLSKEAVKAYKLRQEIAFLQSEIDPALDRRARRGRANFAEPGAPVAPPPPRFTKDNGLYDDE